MFKNIAVAYDDSPEAGRALAAAIRLAKTLRVGLQTITVMEKLPSYTAYGTAADPAMLLTLEEDRKRFYEQLGASAKAAAQREGVELAPHLADGDPTDAIVRFACDQKIDLLVIGLHHRTNRVSRMWSTASAVAQNVPCSLLGVH